jgi:hypothetical protein
MDIESHPLPTSSSNDNTTGLDTNSSSNICETRKRSLSSSATIASVLKKPRTQATSSIRSAIESEPHGILLFFKKATPEQHHAFLASSAEEIEQRMETDEWKNSQVDMRKKAIRREREKTKKRDQRQRRKEHEIANGLRSPGGTKRQVRNILTSLL